MKKQAVINKVSSPSNVAGDLLLTLPYYKKDFSLYNTTTQSAEDSPQRHWGMTSFFNVKAFTLIELLVVVLIIGILAAIALPQYRKAVDKAKLQEALIQGRALLEAEQLYVTANDTITNDLDDLDISMPASSWSCNNGTCSSSVISNVVLQVNNYYGRKHLSLMCEARDAYARQLCISLGGTDAMECGPSTCYLIHKK